MLVFYLTMALSEIVGFPTLSELHRLTQLGQPLYQPKLNLIPFSAGVDLSSFQNILFFVPLGVSLPVMWQRFQHLFPTIIAGLSFSLFIEGGQLFTPYRYTDINDLIMNTLGVIIGWLLARFIFKWQIQRKQGENLDWLLYFLISLVASFSLN
ncbi:MAG: VanZ family protein [Vagococcus sp.]